MPHPDLTLMCDPAVDVAWAESFAHVGEIEIPRPLRMIPLPFAATVRLVDEEEARALNVQFRDKDYVPDVLSFPTADEEAWDEEEDWLYLGDIALCAPVVEAEAAARSWDVGFMARHLVVHGLLHLMGYDHETPDDAKLMEQQETLWLAKLGDPDPYNTPY
jgi:probable rRNA maturation factor